MQLTLIRHTRVAVTKGTCYGQSDVPLASTYASEMSLVKKQLTNIHFDAVYSSPLSRCDILANDLFDGKYKSEAALMEMNFGVWEMQKWDDLSDPYLHEWMNNYQMLACPKGESMKDLQHRVQRFIEQLSVSHSRKSVAMVTHAGVIRSLLMMFQGLTADQAFSQEIKFGGLTVVNV